MENFVTLMSGGAALLLNPMIWFLVLLGTAYGIIAGAMPGIGATLAFGLVLPVTFALTPVHAVALLMSISVGVAYGNSIPAIMVGVPGTPAAILTVLDGFTLHKRGETGLAVGVAYVAAIVGQLISIPMFVLALVPLSGLAYVFLAPEMFGLYLLGVVAVVSLTGKNVVKGLMARCSDCASASSASTPSSSSRGSTSISPSCATDSTRRPWSSGCWRSASCSAPPVRSSSGTRSSTTSR